MGGENAVCVEECKKKKKDQTRCGGRTAQCSRREEENCSRREEENGVRIVRRRTFFAKGRGGLHCTRVRRRIGVVDTDSLRRKDDGISRDDTRRRQD